MNPSPPPFPRPQQNTCTVGYMKGEDRIEVIETDLRMRPLKLTVLRKLGGKLFTVIRDEDQVRSGGPVPVSLPRSPA